MATAAIPAERRRRAWAGTPEIYFHKTIDNSRLVRVSDPGRKREMRMFLAALALLFSLCMVYAWQHFQAIDCGYRIEAAKSQRDSLVEANRQLRLQQASLRDPERIDGLARQLGLQTPLVGQVVRLDGGQDGAEPGGPVIAQMTAASVISPTH